MSNDSSASRDHILVHKMPTAENALSASTNAGGNSANNCIQAAVHALAHRLNQRRPSQFDSVHCVFCRVILTCN